MEHDPQVLNDAARGNLPEEKMLGIIWNLNTDTIVAKPRYNLYGTSRGKILGPNPEDMSDEDIMKTVLTRLTFLRLPAQSYCLLKKPADVIREWSLTFEDFTEISLQRPLQIGRS